jgi:3-oxoacyl-[acyl-carrier-protein] synthase II
MDKKVVITGIGVTTPIGNDKETFWEGLIQGKNGIELISRFDTSEFSTKIAGEVKNFDPSNYIEKKKLKRMDLFCQYALVSAIEAMKDSGLELEKEKKERFGVIVASGIGGLTTWEDQHKRLLKRGPSRISPFFIPSMIVNTAAGSIAIEFGIKGPNFAVSSACASAGHAIGEAYLNIKSGRADVVITGGSEATITPLALAGFCVMRALSTRNDDPAKASRPFDRERDGFVMSEGSAIIILEELEHAKARGAHIYSELAGYGASDDAFHITAPDEGGKGAELSMKFALADSELNVDDIDYVNAHGTSTPLNDKIETKAIKALFGEYANRLPISSNKSMFGHMLGASSASELIATALTIEKGIIPPTINYENPDAECDLDYVPNQAREKEINAAISNSFGFGGHNVTLVLKKINA